MPTILVTGANKGIGLQLCKQLKERGDDVIAVCRVPSDELTKIGVRIIEGIDVSDGDAIVRLKSRISDQPLDVLVNNAGILKGDRFGNLDYDNDCHRRLP